MSSSLDRRARALLDAFSDASRPLGAGSASAVVAAVAAAVVANAARSSAASWDEAGAAAAQADALRARLTPFVHADADAYDAAAALLGGSTGAQDPRRDFALGQALEQAAAVPLQIAEHAADIACLADLVASHARPETRPDVAGAAVLAEAAARVAAQLVAINLGVQQGDARLARATSAVDAAAAAMANVTGLD